MLTGFQSSNSLNGLINLAQKRLQELQQSANFQRNRNHTADLLIVVTFRKHHLVFSSFDAQDKQLAMLPLHCIIGFLTSCLHLTASKTPQDHLQPYSK
jgi:hypothetical protein